MKLYLVRHGEAQEGPDDISRTLTDKGARNVEKVAVFLSRSKVTVSTIFHSGKTRALETAVILQKGVSCVNGLQKAESLAPMDEPSFWVNTLAESKDPVMLVGHLPFMSRLCSFLLCGEDNNNIRFSAGGVVCLEREENGRWVLIWTVTPEFLEQ